MNVRDLEDKILELEELITKAELLIKTVKDSTETLRSCQVQIQIKLNDLKASELVNSKVLTDKGTWETTVTQEWTTSPQKDYINEILRQWAGAISSADKSNLTYT